MARREFGSLNQNDRSSDPDILQLGDITKIRILEPSAEMWLQHSVESQDGDGNDLFRSIVCRGDATCPLCAKGRKNFPITKRYAVNVFDYGSGEVKVLVAGSAIFVKGFERDATLGFNVMDYDYTIKKNGKSKNTTYDVVRMDKTPMPEVDPDSLKDLSRYSDVMTPEKIFETLESMNIVYDELTLPSFTLEEAENFVLPFGKMKGLTVAEAIAQDMGWIDWLLGTREASGDIGDELYIAIQTVLGGDKQPKEQQKKSKPESTPASEFKEIPKDTPAAASTEDEEHVHQCPYCDFKARTETGLNLHIRSKHPDAGEAPASAPEVPVEKASKTAESIDRTTLIATAKEIFMNDPRFGDFSVIAKTLQGVNKNARALNDLSDDELNKLVIGLTIG